jgi:hypothetical protein
MKIGINKIRKRFEGQILNEYKDVEGGNRKTLEKELGSNVMKNLKQYFARVKDIADDKNHTNFYKKMEDKEERIQTTEAAKN